MTLFPGKKRSHARKLDSAYDAINRKFVTATLVRGSNFQFKLSVGKKYDAQMEREKGKLE